MSGTHELKHAKKHTESTATTQTPMPLSNSASVPIGAETARNLVKQTVEVAESEASELKGGKLDRVLGPDAVLATSGHRIARMLERMNLALDEASLEPEELSSAAERLDRAIGSLYVVARKHGLPMREMFLEEVFDREDAFRKNHTVFAPTNRADSYYDVDLVPIQRTYGSAATAGELQHELQDGGGVAEPRTRDDVIAQVLAFANDLRTALDVAFHSAETTIREPNAPKRPDLVEKLLEMAMNVLSAQATSALGTLIGSGLKLAEAKTGAGEHLGAQLTETLIDGFKDAGKENAKVAMGALGDIGARTGKPESEKHEGSKIEPGLSAKSIYLNAAKERTGDAMDATSRRFGAQAKVLKRVPVETLQTLRAAFNERLKQRISQTYHTLLVNEWINFGKAAAENGEEMRDADKRPAHPSKFDQASDPYGVVRISIGTSPEGDPHFLRADLPGVGDAVLAHVRNEDQSLGQIALNRRVDIPPRDSISLSQGAFSVSPDGKISAQLERLDETARMTWARFANKQHTQPVSDGDVYLGMYAVLRWLNGIQSSQIQGGSE